MHVQHALYAPEEVRAGYHLHQRVRGRTGRASSRRREQREGGVFGGSGACRLVN